jgi:hypothetical protein
MQSAWNDCALDGGNDLQNGGSFAELVFNRFRGISSERGCAGCGRVCGAGRSGLWRVAGAVRFRFLPLRFLPGLVVVALHEPVEIGRDVEVLWHLVQHDQLFEVGVAHRAEEFVLLPDRIGHGGGSLAGRWGELELAGRVGEEMGVYQDRSMQIYLETRFGLYSSIENYFRIGTHPTRACNETTLVSRWAR